jgi:hypothetical protein
MKIRILRLLSGAAGILALCAAGLGFLSISSAWDAWNIFRNRSGYLDKDYLVTGAHYSVEGSGDESIVWFWIDGTVDGQSEKLVTHAIKNVRSRKDIEEQYPPGMVLGVKFSPGQGEALHPYGMRRVILSGEFQERMVQPLIWLAGALTLTVLFALARHRLRRKVADLLLAEVSTSPAPAPAAGAAPAVALRPRPPDVPGIARTERGGVLRLEWSNRNVRKDRTTLWVFVVLWMFWAPLTVLVAAMTFRSSQFVGFTLVCIFGGFGTLVIPYVIMRRWSSEWVEFSSGGFTLGNAEILGRAKSYPLAEIAEVGLGLNHDGYESESTVTLGFRRRVRRGRWLLRLLEKHVVAPELEMEPAAMKDPETRRQVEAMRNPELRAKDDPERWTDRVLFAYWLSPELKAWMFEVLQEFAERKAIPLSFKTYRNPD